MESHASDFTFSSQLPIQHHTSTTTFPFSYSYTITTLPCKMATATVAATDLRAELKEWERAFAAANGGKKAGRLDIKSNPDIGTFPPFHSLYEVLTLPSCQIQSIRKTERTRTGQRQRHQPRNHLRGTTQEAKTLLSHRSRTWPEQQYHHSSKVEISRRHLRDALTTPNYPPIPTRPLRLPLRTPPVVQSQHPSTVIDTTESRRWTYATTRWKSIRSVRPPLRVWGEHRNPNCQPASQCPWSGSPDTLSPQ